MKKNLITTLTLLSFASIGYGQSITRKTEQKIDSVFGSWNHKKVPGVAVGLLTNDAVVFSKEYGLSNLEDEIPISARSVFDIASLTKQFTAFAVALLVDSGKISLQDDVRKYIPELPDFGKPILISHLLSHSSGLRDQNELLYLAGWKQEDVITNENILSLLFRQQKLNFSPGEKFSYCNSGYTLLALAIERITRTPFPDWMQNNVFQPLGMINTTFIYSNNQLIKHRAYSYSYGEEGYEKNTLNSATFGARGMQSTVQDLALWVQNFTKHTVGSDRAFELMNSIPENLSAKYGFGQAFATFQNLPVIEHDGSDAGYRSYLGRFPEQKFAVVVLSNSATVNPKSLAMQVAGILLFKKSASAVMPPDKEKKIEVPESVEKGMEGQFQIADDKIMAIWVDDHVLKATVNNQEKIYYLQPVSKTEFNIAELNSRISFKKGGFQTPDSIRYRIENSIKVVPKVFIEDEQSKKLIEYEGTYYSDELDVSYQITRINNLLRVDLPRNSPINLKHQTGDNFTGSYYWFRRIHFFRSETGEPVGFEVSSGRSSGLRFQKK